MKGGPHCRVSSPVLGSSTLKTSAPRSPSIKVQYGPARARVRSTTRMPVSGPGTSHLRSATTLLPQGGGDVPHRRGELVTGEARAQVGPPTAPAEQQADNQSEQPRRGNRAGWTGHAHQLPQADG